MAKRLGKDDWLMLGFSTLSAEGPEAIRLDAICAAAGVTKGSFYHHFGTHEAFLGLLVETWRDWADPEALDYLAEEGAGPLTAIASVSDPMIERGLRQLAAMDAGARAAVEEVDRARLDHLAARTGSVETAELAYAGYIGLQHIGAAVDEDQIAARIERLEALLITSSEPS